MSRQEAGPRWALTGPRNSPRLLMRVQVTAPRDRTPQGHVAVPGKRQLGFLSIAKHSLHSGGHGRHDGETHSAKHAQGAAPQQKPQESCCPGVGGGPPSLSSSSKCLEGPGRSGEDRTQAGWPGFQSCSATRELWPWASYRSRTPFSKTQR